MKKTILLAMILVLGLVSIAGGQTASNPTPADGSEHDDTSVILSWSAGTGAILHDVYFGDNFDDVSNGTRTSGTFRGTQISTSYFIGPLDLCTTYYWRIDEFDGTTIYKGDVWSFSTPCENLPPVADAGPDQTVTDTERDGSEEVVLDGSGSTDPDGWIVSYQWLTGAPPDLLLIGTGINPSVTLPVGIHTITLVVADNDGASDEDTVVITVNEPVNQPPTADAGPDQTVTDTDGDGSEEVVLDGSGSSDPDGWIVSYQWLTGAPPDLLLIGTGINPSVTLPVGIHTITLVVADNDGASDEDTVVITVNEPVNQHPTADAGSDQTVTDDDRDGSEEVVLDGSGSTDPDGEITSYEWWEGDQLITPPVAAPRFALPLPVGVHTITLVVTDNDGATDEDTVVITVQPSDHPIADAGPDQIVSMGGTVRLDGSNSSDARDPNNLLTFYWELVEPPGQMPLLPPLVVGVEDVSQPIASFTMRSDEDGGRVESLTVRLNVTDTDGNSDTDDVVITVVEDANNTIFVSSRLGDDSNNGSPNAPVETLNRAFELASQPHSDMYVDGGGYSSDSTLTILDDMSLCGGFVATEVHKYPDDPPVGITYYIEWKRTPSTIISNRAYISGAPTALEVLDVGSRTRIEGLSIQSSDGSAGIDGPGENSVGISVIDSSGNLSITNNFITAGFGGTGSDGIPGINGEDGNPGSNGQDGRTLLAPQDEIQALITHIDEIDSIDDLLAYINPLWDGFSNGGSGGNGPCGNSGGQGGTSPAWYGLVPNAHCLQLGECTEEDVVITYQTGGEEGEPADSGNHGGYGGLYYVAHLDDWKDLLYVDPTKYAASEGGAGTDGLHGKGGAGGVTLCVYGDMWQGESGEDGQDGITDGSGGGGGGAGYPDVFSVPFVSWLYIPVSGGGGGGGGSGGCKGTAGTGGFAGGNSFGISLISSSPVIAGNTICTEGGGDGGKGGRGGTGGSGGSSGSGGDGEELMWGLGAESGDGKRGGRGGAGGSGGGGGGGSGGASCGIYHTEGSIPPPEENNCFTSSCDGRVSGFTLIGLAGMGGAGGPGGAGSGPESEGADGEAGCSSNICPPPGPPIDVPPIPDRDTVEVTVNVGTGVGVFTLSNTWGGSDIVMTLISPSGWIIDRDTDDPNVVHLLGPTFEIYKIRNPEAGVWTVELFGADVPEEGEEVVLTMSTEMLPTQDACLASHWKLDETSGMIAGDSSGNGNHGTLYGNPIWQPTVGMVGGSLELDGYEDYVEIPKIGESVEFTYAMWVAQNQIGSGLIPLINHKDWIYGSVHFELRDGHPKVGINGDITPADDLDAWDYTLAAGEWHHVAVAKSATLLVIYVNGEEAALRELTISDTVILGDGFIGAWVDPNREQAKYFNGWLDEVRIYNCALDENEIKALMSGTPSLNLLSEALDTDLFITTGGNADWFSQIEPSHYGGGAAQSGDISHNQNSWMQTTVSGAGTASFYWKVSSEEDYDFLEFYLDGSMLDRISGSTDWQKKAYRITGSDSHKLEWRYMKDKGTDSGLDCGWVDNVEFTTN